VKTRSERLQDHDAEERQAPSGRVVYRAIYREGMEELSRDAASLSWSGLAAGLAMGSSLVVEAVLRSHLPDASWRPLVAKMGYGVGFLIIILGRQQLFTENTLTVVLPVLRIWSNGVLMNVLRLWAVVFVANMIGAALFAVAIVHLPVLEPSVREAATALGFEALAPGAWSIFARGIFAGWLIALMVWLLPFAESARVAVILLITYVVGIASFSHVVAGSVEVFVLSAQGLVPWLATLLGFTLPALAGNTVGGVALVAALGHAQFVEGEDVLL
jgi:formate/nitrite transporter FocA (FNT family)